MRALLAVARAESVLRWRSLIGGCGFAAFGCFWTTVTFLLSGPRYGFSQLDIGLLAPVLARPERSPPPAAAGCWTRAGNSAGSRRARRLPVSLTGWGPLPFALAVAVVEPFLASLTSGPSGRTPEDRPAARV
jgi:hypothetical protein